MQYTHTFAKIKRLQVSYFLTPAHKVTSHLPVISALQVSRTHNF